MSYAANGLENLYLQAAAHNQKNAQLIQQDASFVSYVAMALVGNNMKFLVGTNDKTVVTITPNQAKKLVQEIYTVLSKNTVDGAIPHDKVDIVYSSIHNLIPKDLKSIGVFTHLYY
ncbi:hypothetical protein [Alicyclobacillus sp. SO9]|uniref:hypothetical protein n=1 Tax=Alicyclobacillus sp. SO9 TaxID=2665646 RepID=UPI0018E8E1EE|nr:hypothetical protein [Alicyclobacillus sp. SO9]QQE79760.1 hypothetical protein GI364_04530 [Alicyclobacillus sp. SO9]